MEIKYCLRFFKVGSETCFVGFDYDHAPPVPRIGETVGFEYSCETYNGFKVVKVNYDYPDSEDSDGIVMIDVMVEENTDEHEEGNAW